jgi:hypothetical protein
LVAESATSLRRLFGNPFRPDPVLAHGGSTVAKLAAAVYDDRTFERLPVLADPLEDAGCSDREILAHCRSVVSMCASARPWTRRWGRGERR